MKFKTADKAENVDVYLELHQIKGVGMVTARHQFWSGGVDKKYDNVDFYILMMNNSKEDKIRKLLNNFGYSAWLEYESEYENEPPKMVYIGPYPPEKSDRFMEVKEKLESFDAVFSVVHCTDIVNYLSCVKETYREMNIDFHIVVSNESYNRKIKNLLKETGYSAVIENDLMPDILISIKQVSKKEKSPIPLTPISFILPTDLFLGQSLCKISAKYFEDNIPTKWAIEKGQCTMDKETGMFFLEPTGSEVTDEWLSKHRFNSPEEAYQCWIKFNPGFSSFQIPKNNNAANFSYEEVCEIALDVMNMGMDLRQKQLNGYGGDKSGKQLLDEYMQKVKKD